ncbi:hypothetical protein GWK47_017567 [Chionoecetes opilio]|uniref:Uncharacterized protein n=1 Tax=Chionoecetes opilio TaxID=41210 RepID=A0A8J5CH29_CHIOP|nr:hypothetical protein GWK47_017567 [Chionoecetes opilio]
MVEAKVQGRQTWMEADTGASTSVICEKEWRRIPQRPRLELTQRRLVTYTAAQMQRYALQLAAYKYSVEMRRFEKMAMADALSRMPLADIEDRGGPEKGELGQRVQCAVFGRGALGNRSSSSGSNAAGCGVRKSVSLCLVWTVARKSERRYSDVQVES